MTNEKIRKRLARCRSEDYSFSDGGSWNGRGLCPLDIRWLIDILEAQLDANEELQAQLAKLLEAAEAAYRVYKRPEATTFAYVMQSLGEAAKEVKEAK